MKPSNFLDVQTGECLNPLRLDQPYERMNITGVSGLPQAQKADTQDLGAVDLAHKEE